MQGKISHNHSLKYLNTLNEQPDSGTCRSQRVLHLDLIGSRVQTSGVPQEQTGGFECVFECELGGSLKLSAILEPLNSGSRFGYDIKFELHIRFGPVLDLVEVLLRYFNLWGTWMINQKNRQVSSNSERYMHHT